MILGLIQTVDIRCERNFPLSKPCPWFVWLSWNYFFFLSLWEVVSNCSNNSDMLYMDPSWKPSQDLKGYRELSWLGLWCKNLFSLIFHMKYRLIWKENITVNQKSHAVFSLASLNWFPTPLNPFLLGISMHIFHTVS